ncbi:MAG TPA: OmpA family protein, partial [Methylomirabilota bacterium]|nr:OmpA family protein [Methylomirabilota bacterium]
IVKRREGTWELLILVGVLGLAVAGMVATAWVQTDGPDSAAASAAVEPTVETATQARAAVRAPATPSVLHADLYFDFKSTRLRADAVRVLQENVALMDASDGWVVLVQGYADRHGPADYNRALAQRRAEAVKQFLAELGVPEISIRVASVGQDGALCDDPGAECQQLNRRVHVEMRKLPGAGAADTTPVATGQAR